MPQIISANRLANGTVVYLGPDGSWREGLAAARVFTSEAEAKAWLRAATSDAKHHLILDPGIVEVAHDQAGLRALSLRDAIRALGPTVDFAPRTQTSSAQAERS